MNCQCEGARLTSGCETGERECSSDDSEFTSDEVQSATTVLAWSAVRTPSHLYPLIVSEILTVQNIAHVH